MASTEQLDIRYVFVDGGVCIASRRHFDYLPLMIGQGSLVNGAAILAGGVVGWAVGRHLDQRYRSIAQQGLGLATILIGIKMALAIDNILILVGSILLGGICGEFLRIEAQLERGAQWLQRRSRSSESTFAEGFVTATLLFCVGSMAILGSIDEGVRANSSILFTKSILDGAAAITFASTLGLGVAFAAVPVFLYQGAMTVGASFVAPLLTAPIVNEFSATGGLLIASIGLNLLNLTKIPIGNLLPAIFFAAVAKMVWP